MAKIVKYLKGILLINLIILAFERNIGFSIGERLYNQGWIKCTNHIMNNGAVKIPCYGWIDITIIEVTFLVIIATGVSLIALSCIQRHKKRGSKIETEK